MTLPPGFACMFSRKVVGIVTKIDLPGADRCKARAILHQAGVKDPIFFVSAKSGEGLEEIIEYFTERRDYE
jgi:ethanolamine utilization protein EutP